MCLFKSIRFRYPRGCRHLQVNAQVVVATKHHLETSEKKLKKVENQLYRFSGEKLDFRNDPRIIKIDSMGSPRVFKPPLPPSNPLLTPILPPTTNFTHMCTLIFHVFLHVFLHIVWGPRAGIMIFNTVYQYSIMDANIQSSILSE